MTDVFLERVEHDRPLHGQYGSVLRATRRNRSFKDDEDVEAFAETGIDRSVAEYVRRLQQLSTVRAK